MCLLISDLLLRASFLRTDRKRFVRQFHIFGCKPKNASPAIGERGVQLAVSICAGPRRTPSDRRAACCCCAVPGCSDPGLHAAPLCCPCFSAPEDLQLGVQLGVTEQALSQSREQKLHRKGNRGSNPSSSSAWGALWAVWAVGAGFGLRAFCGFKPSLLCILETQTPLPPPPRAVGRGETASPASFGLKSRSDTDSKIGLAWGRLLDKIRAICII